MFEIGFLLFDSRKLREMTTDVGILGMGVAGMTAALSAAEKGLKVQTVRSLVSYSMNLLFRLTTFSKVDIFDRMAEVTSPIGGGFALNGALLCLTRLGLRRTYEKHMMTINHGHQITDGKTDTVTEFAKHIKGLKQACTIPWYTVSC